MKGIVAVAVVAICAVQVVSGLSNLQILLNGINRQKADVQSTLDRLQRHKRDFSNNLQHKLSNMKLNSMQEINSILDQALKNVKNATDKSTAEGKDASQCYEAARVKLREYSQTGFSDLESCRKEVLSSISPTEANIDSTILTGQQVISYFDSIFPSCFSTNTQQMEFCIIGKIPQGTQMAKAFESTTNTVINSSNLAANQALINGMNCNWGVTSKVRDGATSVRIDAIIALVMCPYFVPILNPLYGLNFDDLDPVKFSMRLFNVIQWFAMSVIIVSWGFRQKSAACVMNRLLEVDVRLSNLEKMQFNKQALIFSIIHVILNVSLWIIFWSTHVLDHNLEVFEIRILAYLPTIIIYWFIIEYFTIVSLISRDLQTVNNYFLEFREFGNRLSRPALLRYGHLTVVGLPTYYSSHLTSLELLYNIRTTLFEVCKETTDFFSLSALFCIAVIFGSVFIELQWYLFYETPGNSLVNTPAMIIGYIVLVYIYPLISLALSITQTRNEAKRTGQIVHRLLAVVIRQEIREKLNSFSK